MGTMEYQIPYWMAIKMDFSMWKTEVYKLCFKDLLSLHWNTSLWLLHSILYACTAVSIHVIYNIITYTCMCTCSIHWCALTATCVPSGFVSTITSPSTAWLGLCNTFVKCTCTYHIQYTLSSSITTVWGYKQTLYHEHPSGCYYDSVLYMTHSLDCSHYIFIVPADCWGNSSHNDPRIDNCLTSIHTGTSFSA